MAPRFVVLSVDGGAPEPLRGSHSPDALVLRVRRARRPADHGGRRIGEDIASHFEPPTVTIAAIILARPRAPRLSISLKSSAVLDEVIAAGGSIANPDFDPTLNAIIGLKTVFFQEVILAT